jgi:hypothetical protein
VSKPGSAPNSNFDTLTFEADCAISRVSVRLTDPEPGEHEVTAAIEATFTLETGSRRSRFTASSFEGL